MTTAGAVHGDALILIDTDGHDLTAAAPRSRGEPWSAARLTVLAIAALVGVTLAWAWVTPVAELTSATGAVVPAGRIKQVQHPEGGRIEDILVGEGQVVQARQVLLRLEPTAIRAALEQARGQADTLALRGERLRAVLEEREPQFGPLADRWPEQAIGQQRLWASQSAELLAAVALVDLEIERRQREIDQLQRTLAVTESQRTVAADLSAMRAEGVRAGVVSRQVYLETRQAELAAEAEVHRAADLHRQAREALAESERRRSGRELGLRHTLLRELEAADSERRQVLAAVAQWQERADRLEVRAPVAGIVQDLRVHTIGEVVPSGGILLALVPLDDRLEVEARIDADQIGQIHAGQRVRLRFTAYDRGHGGAFEAVLARLSPTTFLDDHGKPYYRGVVPLERSWIGPADGQNPILPGMMVVADIITGRRTLADHLMRPLTRRLDALWPTG